MHGLHGRPGMAVGLQGQVEMGLVQGVQYLGGVPLGEVVEPQPKRGKAMDGLWRHVWGGASHTQAKGE